MGTLDRIAAVSSVSFHKLGSALGTGAVVASLLFGAGIAQATEVTLDGNNNVIRIDNLEVFDDREGAMLYDVQFVFNTATNVYGSNYDFDFPQEDNALFALEAVLNALNANNTRPQGAGPNGTEQFHIGVEFDDGFIATVAGENINGVWDQCRINDCALGTAIRAANKSFTYAKFSPAGNAPPSSGTVNLSGDVENASGTGLCAMVLASGKFQFSCNPDGPFSLTDLPRESNDTVKRQVYVDGSFPNVEVLQGSVNESVVMTRAGSCPNYNEPYSPRVSPDDAGKRVNISGTILLQNSGTPVCAMVLANGEFEFSCNGSGTYSLNIPLDNNGQFKLQVYADGFAPITQRFDDSSVMNDVRLARAAECQ